MSDWRTHLVESEAGITALLARTRTIAVLGIKVPGKPAPAYDVPAYAQRAGFRIIPVPVYYPEVTPCIAAATAAPSFTSSWMVLSRSPPT